MPKLVDHAHKRRQIIEATWRLVATRGFEAATMREIAAEAGHANGALGHYFTNKEELLRAAYLFVWEETNLRIGKRLEGATGLDAVRVYWDEISPGSDVAQLEARIVLPFFARAAIDPSLARITAHTMDQWREEFVVHVDHARAGGQVTPRVPTDVIVEHLMNMLLGLQILGVVGADEDVLRRQRDMLERYLQLLAPAVSEWT